MGKRSSFEKLPRSKYYTPVQPVRFLRPFIGGISTFIEPCAGDGRLIGHVEALGPRCVFSCDIEPDAGTSILRADALQLDLRHIEADAIITNPPWEREDLHPMIRHFSEQFPTWLLFDSDWAFNVQSGPFLRQCSHIVAVGRVKWMEDTSDSGKENCAWYRFDARHNVGPRFYGRGAS